MNRVWSKYWMLTIIAQRQISKNGRNREEVDCTCDCWWTRTILFDRLREWTRNCGCMTPSIENSKQYIGKKYNQLTIVDVQHSERKNTKEIIAKYKCDCGEEKQTAIYNVISGKQKSCWCSRWATSWMRKTRAYSIRRNMKNSCEKEDHPMYHRRWAKGITYQSSRDSFSWRWAEWGKWYSDDKYFTRIDLFKNFTSDNCKWDSSYGVSKLDLFDNF